MLPRTFILAVLCTACMAAIAMAGWPQLIAFSVVLAVITFLFGGILRIIFTGLRRSTSWLATIIVVAVVFSIIGGGLLTFIKNPEVTNLRTTEVKEYIVQYLPPTPIVLGFIGLALIAMCPGFGRVGCPLLAACGVVILFIFGPTACPMIVETFRTATEEQRAYYLAYGFAAFVLLMILYLASNYGGPVWTNTLHPMDMDRPPSFHPTVHRDPHGGRSTWFRL